MLASPAVVEREVGPADLGIRGRSRERSSLVMNERRRRRLSNHGEAATRPTPSSPTRDSFLSVFVAN
ncbi:hypothetical protein BRD01_15165 [Halobacteriales archaeon QS_8_65_32]|nr:MAG: hypothetical protein BRD01_15165 [Halobacteriales archaeon QS_8_65_32]